MLIIFEREREREREKESASGGGAERKGDTESQAGSRLWPVSTEPDAGLKPANCGMMTWAEVGELTDWATQVSLFLHFERKYSVQVSNPEAYKLELLQFTNTSDTQS